MKPINRASVVSTGTGQAVTPQRVEDPTIAPFTHAHDPAAESLLATALQQHGAALA
jgi:hypothetical protein